MDRDNGQRGGGVEPLRHSARGTTPESAALPGAARRDMSNQPTNANRNNAVGFLDDALDALTNAAIVLGDEDLLLDQRHAISELADALAGRVLA